VSRQLEPNARRREHTFLQHLSKERYNLSGLSGAEAEALIRDNEGQLCVRSYRRADGTVLTGDCPVEEKTRPQRWLVCTTIVLLAPLLAFGAALGGGQARHSPLWNTLCATQPIKTVLSLMQSQASMGTPVMGK
jgi:hypothetical protein